MELTGITLYPFHFPPLCNIFSFILEFSSLHTGFVLNQCPINANYWIYLYVVYIYLHLLDIFISIRVFLFLLQCSISQVTFTPLIAITTLTYQNI
ncbi:hypothetical protein V8C43DRAFT_286468, partial [Trichoderma afarasin]